MRPEGPGVVRRVAWLECFGALAYVGEVLAAERTLPYCATIALCCTACIEPTQVTVEVSSDVCDRLVDTAITVGPVGDVELRDPTTTTTGCSGESVGTLVVVPAADETRAWGLKIVGNVSADPNACQPPEYGPDCIVVRRSMRYVKERRLTLPIVLRSSCLGVLCPEDQTCVAGECRTADCGESETCDETSLPPIEGVAWARAPGGAGADVAFGLTPIVGGDVAVTGAAGSALDFGGGPLDYQGGAADMFVARLGPNGTHRWSRGIGGSGNDIGNSVAGGPTGLVHVAGSFSGEVTLGGDQHTSRGLTDALVATFSGLGTPQWSAAFGGPGDDAAVDVVGDAQGNVYVGGSFSGALTIDDATMLTGSDLAGFVMGLDRFGKHRWSHAMGETAAAAVTDVALDPFGNLIVVGSFEATTTLGSETLISRGDRDAFVARLAASTGVVDWATTLGSDGNDVAVAVAVDPTGARIAVTGALGGPAVIGETVLSALGGDGYVLVLDGSGALAWSTVFGDVFFDSGEAVAYDSAGRLYLSGHFGGEITLAGTTLVADDARNMLTAAFEPDGALRWAQTLAVGEFASVRGIAPGGNDSAFLAGYFAPTVDLNGTLLTSKGDSDILLGRLLAPGDTP